MKTLTRMSIQTLAWLTLTIDGLLVFGMVHTAPSNPLSPHAVIQLGEGVEITSMTPEGVLYITAGVIASAFLAVTALGWVNRQNLKAE